MKPTRCKCGAYVAPQCTKCPRCGERAHHAAAAVQSETELATNAREAQARLDREAKVLDAKKIEWVLPKEAQQYLAERLAQLRERRGSTSRDDLRLIKEGALARRIGRWSWVRGERNTLILVSGKGNRYVKARTNERADLILDYGLKDRSGWVFGKEAFRVRLKRFENSSAAKTLKKAARVDKALAVREKVKQKAQRLKRRQKEQQQST